MDALLERLHAVLDELAAADDGPLAHPDVVVMLRRARSRLDSVVHRQAAAVQASAVWVAAGAQNASAWITTTCRAERRVARGHVRLGQALRAMDVTAPAFRRGCAPQRRADALVEMATRARTAPVGGRRPKPLFTVLVGEADFARTIELASGSTTTPGSLARWIDESVIERVVFDGPDRVLAVGSNASSAAPCDVRSRCEIAPVGATTATSLPRAARSTTSCPTRRAARPRRRTAGCSAVPPSPPPPRRKPPRFLDRRMRVRGRPRIRRHRVRRAPRLRPPTNHLQVLRHRAGVARGRRRARRRHVSHRPVGDDVLHHHGGVQPADAGQPGELLVPDALVVRDVGAAQAEEVVGVAEEPLRLGDVRDLGQQPLERDHGGLIRPVHRHHHDHLETEPQRRRVDERAIAGDDARPLELAHAAVARRDARPHAVGELGDGEPAVALQFRKELPVDGVHVVDRPASTERRPRSTLRPSILPPCRARSTP